MNQLNIPRTEKARAFLAKKPTYINSICGVDYYEHPAYGDESPLICILADGRLKRSAYWDMPSFDAGMLEGWNAIK